VLRSGVSDRLETLKAEIIAAVLDAGWLLVAA
jgi:hypothetical protein